MSYQPNDPYRARQIAPLTQSLPRRTMREVTHGPSLPAGAAVPVPQAQQATELAQRYELLDRLGSVRRIIGGARAGSQRR
jgi:hypothetical protein